MPRISQSKSKLTNSKLGLRSSTLQITQSTETSSKTETSTISVTTAQLLIAVALLGFSAFAALVSPSMFESKYYAEMSVTCTNGASQYSIGECRSTDDWRNKAKKYCSSGTVSANNIKNISFSKKCPSQKSLTNLISSPVSVPVSNPESYPVGPAI